VIFQIGSHRLTITPQSYFFLPLYCTFIVVFCFGDLPVSPLCRTLAYAAAVVWNITGSHCTQFSRRSCWQCHFPLVRVVMWPRPNQSITGARKGSLLLLCSSQLLLHDKHPHLSLGCSSQNYNLI
jgi:hypothetical protein